eukprot:scaffold8323_cov116-Isochrysis_galbana.AAC.1
MAELVFAPISCSCPWSGSHCDPTEILEFVRLAVFWAMRVGRRVLWVRWKDLFQTLPMVPGSSGVSQRFLCCGHGKLELACNQVPGDSEKEPLH